MEVSVTLKICELVSIVLSALVAGVFWGPWVGLTRSMASFEPEIFLAIVRRLSRNIAPVMTFLMPVALLSIVPALIFSFGERPKTFYLFLGGLFLFVVALGVTMFVEVPIVKQIETWTVATLPDNWKQLRDRWGAFHVVRVVVSVAGLGLLVAGAIF
jgi:uncharacterized membrane protein